MKISNNNSKGSISRRVWGQLEKVQTICTSATTKNACTFDIFRLFLNDDGTFPNNPDYPLLFYKSACCCSSSSSSSTSSQKKKSSRSEWERAIVSDGEWTSPWAWGVFPYHHYHSKAWELLLCIQGQAHIQMGGETGPKVFVQRGDLLLVPPGLAHKQLDDDDSSLLLQDEQGADDEFTLLGSYPTRGYTGIDTLTRPPTTKERTAIATCPVPARDPVFGLSIPSLCSYGVLDMK